MDLYESNGEEFLLVTGRYDFLTNKGFSLSMSTEVMTQYFSCFAENVTAWVDNGATLDPGFIFHVTTETAGSQYLVDFFNVPIGVTPETITAYAGPFTSIGSIACPSEVFVKGSSMPTIETYW